MKNNVKPDESLNSHCELNTCNIGEIVYHMTYGLCIITALNSDWNLVNLESGTAYNFKPKELVAKTITEVRYKIL